MRCVFPLWLAAIGLIGWVARGHGAQDAMPTLLPEIEVYAPQQRENIRRRRNWRGASSAIQPAATCRSAAGAAPAAGEPATSIRISLKRRHCTRRGDQRAAVSRGGGRAEGVPGLVVTQHSGDGKANQYFLRGFNLDHGTDLAISVDDMPVNMRTHAHGQGYADLNFLIPELVGSINIRKGPYFADEGDFSSVGSVHVSLLDSIRTMASMTVGSFGYRRILGVTSSRLGDGTLLIAGEANTYNGPWDDPDRLRKFNGVVRYSQGTADNGFTLTAMAYTNKWKSTDQIPPRAVDREIGLYGAMDPTDGGIPTASRCRGPMGADRETAPPAPTPTPSRAR